tara:strand:+ start:5196 stop:5777 length:582 start_codon:yes stop_codon:yes gene_type:complete
MGHNLVKNLLENEAEQTRYHYLIKSGDPIEEAGWLPVFHLRAVIRNPIKTMFSIAIEKFIKDKWVEVSKKFSDKRPTDEEISESLDVLEEVTGLPPIADDLTYVRLVDEAERLVEKYGMDKIDAHMVRTLFMTLRDKCEVGEVIDCIDDVAYREPNIPPARIRKFWKGHNEPNQGKKTNQNSSRPTENGRIRA